MFQYTTETIINSNTGNLEGGVRFKFFGTAATENAAAAGTLIVDGVNSFLGREDIKVKAYHSPWRKVTPAKATITSPSGLKKGDVIRLTVTIREQGSTRSTIQNAYKVRTKPFHYEIEVKTVADAMKDLVKVIRKDLGMTDFKYFTVSDDGLTYEAADGYIQFEDVELVKVLDPADGVTHFGGYANERVEVLYSAKGEKTITAGDPGAGTVARIIKDLRIPTGASINPFGTDHGGMPIPGGKYHQYTIEYETPRAHVAGGVVGSVGEFSRTTHVFFVEEGTKGLWETELKKLCKDIIEAGNQNDNKNLTNGGTKDAEINKTSEKSSVQ